MVVVVVGRGDLHRPSPEVALDHLVGDDRDVALDERDPDAPSDDRLVARVVGVDRDGDVAEDRLRAGRGHRDQRRRGAAAPVASSSRW